MKPDEVKKYKIELTENQARIVQDALEEYFRLRMGQTMDFCDDLARINTDLSPENPEHDKIFGRFIQRRAHLQEVMRAFFGIAFSPERYLDHKTDDMLIAECMWDAVRFARGKSRWDAPFQIGPEPFPRIEVITGEQ